MKLNKLICAAIVLMCSATVSAGEMETRHGTSIELDNDLFSGQDDRDYSFGGTLTFYTPSSNRLIAGIDAIRQHLNGRLAAIGGAGLGRAAIDAARAHWHDAGTARVARRHSPMIDRTRACSMWPLHK